MELGLAVRLDTAWLIFWFFSMQGVLVTAVSERMYGSFAKDPDCHGVLLQVSKLMVL